VNLVGRDGENGPVLVSVKAETVAGQEHWRVLLRLRAGSTHDLVPAVNLTSNPTPSKMVKVKATFMILSGSEECNSILSSLIISNRICALFSLIYIDLPVYLKILR